MPSTEGWRPMGPHRTKASWQRPCFAMSIAAMRAAAVKQQRWRTISLRCSRICEIKVVFCWKAKQILALFLSCELLMADHIAPFSVWFDLGGLSDAGAEITLSPAAA